MQLQNNLKWYHFLGAWGLCLVSGFLLIGFFYFLLKGDTEGFGLALITTALAFLCSLPFIILFCILVHYLVLKKENTRNQAHLTVFLMHFFGSTIVFFIIALFAGGNEELPLLGIMFGYFTLDSIFFHRLIHVKYRSSPSKKADNDLLDGEL